MQLVIVESFIKREHFDKIWKSQAVYCIKHDSLVIISCGWVDEIAAAVRGRILSRLVCQHFG